MPSRWNQPRQGEIVQLNVRVPMNTRSHSGFIILIFVFAATAVLTGCRVSVKKSDTINAVASTSEEQTKAVESMRTFLSEVDKENGETWEHLSQKLKASTSQTAWSAIIAAMKMARGKKISRGNAQGACTEELPDAPKGRYFIFDIDSKFERAALTERVVLSWENGQWKVAGYFLTKSIPFRDEPKKP
jgi:hypothetical protein